MRSARAEWLTMMLHRISFDAILCVLIALFLGVWFFIVTRRRSIWLRYTAAEAAFWRRVGFPPARFTAACQRFEESRGFATVIGFLAIVASLLFVYFVGLYLWFTHTFHGT